MKRFNLVMVFALMAALAALSPPAVSFYYDQSGPITVSIASVD